jgi:hypothetical protein
VSGNDCRTHQQPCFCDLCWLTTVSDLIGERAVILQAALTDRLYTDGMEREMADDLIAAIPSGLRLTVLAHMLTWDHLQPRVMNVDCLLDECDERSYAALDQMGAVLLAAIQVQGAEGHALKVLIVNEITNPVTAQCHAMSPVQKPGRVASAEGSDSDG